MPNAEKNGSFRIHHSAFTIPELLYGEEHPCAFCRGTGQVGGAHQCPVCGGAAKVRLTPPVVRCAFCHGGGHMPLRSDATCPACKRAMKPASEVEP